LSCANALWRNGVALAQKILSNVKKACKFRGIGLARGQLVE
jgi:hypothetical protein